jgi:PmbA protein
MEMMDENSLLELCRHIVSSGERKGATAAEALARSNSEIESNIELAQISSVNRRVGVEIAIRVYLGKRMGSAFTNISTRDAAEEAVGLAVTAAKATTEDQEWKELPHPARYPAIDGLWDDDASVCEPAKVVELAGEFMEKAVEAEPALVPAFGGSGVGVLRTAYANSNGVAHAERGTISYAYLAAIAQIESGVTPAIESYDIRRDLDLDIDKAVEDVVSTIRVCRRTAKGLTGKHTVIMHPNAYSQILYYTLLQAVRGDNVARGKSKIADRIGDKIVSDLVTITDDGTIPRGAATSASDDEGVPHRRTPIIDGGVLKSFLWDSYWANRMGEKSTGNARRSMRQGLVEISSTNTVVEPGSRDIHEIFSEVEYGYLIRNVQGAHSSNPESGDFSVVGNPAILIEDGEMVGAVHGLMVAGNVFDLLSQATEVAKTPIFLQGVIGPEMAFHDVSVIARE